MLQGRFCDRFEAFPNIFNALLNVIQIKEEKNMIIFFQNRAHADLSHFFNAHINPTVLELVYNVPVDLHELPNVLREQIISIYSVGMA